MKKGKRIKSLIWIFPKLHFKPSHRIHPSQCCYVIKIEAKQMDGKQSVWFKALKTMNANCKVILSILRSPYYNLNPNFGTLLHTAWDSIISKNCCFCLLSQKFPQVMLSLQILRFKWGNLETKEIKALQHLSEVFTLIQSNTHHGVQRTIT